MNIVLVEPSFPQNQRRFAQALAGVGANVVGVGEASESELGDELRGQLVAYYQVNSPYLVDNLNTLNVAGTYGKPETWSATIGYLANLRPGAYLTVSLNYTANPSQAFYFGPSAANPSQRFEGNALNFQAALFTAF